VIKSCASVQDPMANRERGKDSPAARFPVSRRHGAALELVGGDIAGVPRGDGDRDEVRKRTVSTRA
jgi:hypothetical protein